MLALLALAAVQTGYQTDFEDPAGWTVVGQYPPGSLVGWSFDASPSDVPGGPSRGGKSLNYNNGVDYHTPGSDNVGVVAGPVLDAGGLSDPRLAFWCNYVVDPEASDDDPDLRYLRFVPVLPDGQEDTSGTFAVILGTEADHPLIPCAAMGVWHRHEWRLGSVGPLTRFKVEFVFDARTARRNAFPGWFIDDLSVAAAPAVAGGAGAGDDDASSGGNCGALGLEVLVGLAVGAAGRRRFVRS